MAVSKEKAEKFIDALKRLITAIAEDHQPSDPDDSMAGMGSWSDRHTAEEDLMKLLTGDKTEDT